MKKNKAFIAVFLIFTLVLCSLNASAVEKPTEEKFRVELDVTGAVNSNIVATSLPYGSATLKLSTLNDNLGIVGGVSYYNDLWVDNKNQVKFFQRMNYIAGVSLYDFTLTGGIYVNPETKEIEFGSAHLDYTKDLWQARQGHLVESVALRFGLDCMPMIPTYDEDSSNGQKVFGTVFVALFSLIPRPSIGVTMKLGAGF